MGRTLARPEVAGEAPGREAVRVGVFSGTLLFPRRPPVVCHAILPRRALLVARYLHRGLWRPRIICRLYAHQREEAVGVVVCRDRPVESPHMDRRFLLRQQSLEGVPMRKRKADPAGTDNDRAAPGRV
jgi:hypothetical protein